MNTTAILVVGDDTTVRLSTAATTDIGSISFKAVLYECVEGKSELRDLLNEFIDARNPIFRWLESIGFKEPKKSERIVILDDNLRNKLDFSHKDIAFFVAQVARKLRHAVLFVYILPVKVDDENNEAKTALRSSGIDLAFSTDVQVDEFRNSLDLYQRTRKKSFSSPALYFLRLFITVSAVFVVPLLIHWGKLFITTKYNENSVTPCGVTTHASTPKE